MPATLVVVLALAAAASACASRRLELPSGTGTAFPGYQEAFAAASAGCRGVRTLTAEAAVSGTVGRGKLRGRVLVGFERPGRMRLEAVAPMGAPVFILAADGPAATLLMPRSNDVVRGEPTESILEALIGVSLRPDDLQAILAGCVTADPTATGGQQFSGGWVRVGLEGGSSAFLQQRDGQWRIRAGLRPLLAVEYERDPGTGPTPQIVRLRSAADGGPGADLRLALSQVETNVPIAAKAFTVVVPQGALPMTLAELKQSGPLGERR